MGPAPKEVAAALLSPKQTEVGDDRWVPLAGPTSQRAGESSARGWAKAWAEAGRWAAAWLGGPLAKGREGRRELGRGRESRPRKERGLSFFFVKQKI